MPPEMSRLPRASCCLVLLATFAGCATSLSTFQPAHIAPKGHVSAQAGIDIALPVSTFTRTIDAAKTLANAGNERKLTEDEQLQLLDAGATVALSPPGAVTHLAITFTPLERLEVGIFKASAAWRLGVRRQVLEQDSDGVDLTVGLGAQRFAYEFPVGDVIPGIEIEDFVRWNFDLPITLGRHGDFFRVWAGPHFAATSYDTHLKVNGGMVGQDLAGIEGSGFYAAGTAGGALGYKKLFLAFELTIARYFGVASLSATLPRGTRSSDVDLGTWVVFPGLALLGEF